MLLSLLFVAAAQSTPEPAPTTEEDAPAAPVPAPAPTADAFAKAKLLYENGSRLYEEAQYEASIQAFREAYALSQQHELLYNIASAQERMGDLAGAVETLNTFRIYAPAEEQEPLDRKLRTLERRLDEERAKARQAELDAAAAAARLKAQAAPQPVAPVTNPSNPIKPALLVAGGAVAVVFGAFTAGTFIAGNNAKDKETYDTARILNLTSGGIAIAGVGVAAIGLALPAKKKTPGVAVILRADEAHVSTSWRF